MATAGKKPTAIISVSIIHDMVLPYPAVWRSAPPMIPPAARSAETAVVAGRLLGSGSGGSVSSDVSVLSWETALTETGTIKQAQTAMAPAIAIRNGMFCTGQCRTVGFHGNREISCARVEKFAQWRGAIQVELGWHILCICSLQDASTGCFRSFGSRFYRSCGDFSPSFERAWCVVCRACEFAHRDDGARRSGDRPTRAASFDPQCLARRCWHGT